MRLLIFFLMVTVLSSCTHKNQDKKTPMEADAALPNEKTADISSISTDGVYFKANGNEPFWSLEISDQTIRIKTPTDSLITPSADPTRSDSSMIQYRLETEKSIVHIDILRQECINSMSGHKSPYVTNLSYRLTSEKDLTSVHGCGQYLTDYRLHDIWVLESIDSRKPDPESIEGKLPSLEINGHKNSFRGFTGCNQMNGEFKYRYKEIRFHRIATTRRYCPKASVLETRLLEYLRQWNHYSIAKNRLILKQGDEEIVIFRKID